MAKKKTDRTHKQIIAEYANCQNYSEVARKFKLSVSGVKKIVLRDKDSLNLCNEKKKQNDLDMIQYLESQKTTAQSVISQILKNLNDPGIINKASAQQQATVLGIVVDKFILPYTNKVNKADDDNYKENKDTVKNKLLECMGDKGNDKIL